MQQTTACLEENNSTSCKLLKLILMEEVLQDVIENIEVF